VDAIGRRQKQERIDRVSDLRAAASGKDDFNNHVKEISK
jgi:hypothetical protein